MHYYMLTFVSTTIYECISIISKHNQKHIKSKHANGLSHRYISTYVLYHQIITTDILTCK